MRKLVLSCDGSLSAMQNARKALNACYETVRAAQPDLIIVTGDIAYATVQTVNRNNLKPIYQFAHFLNRVGIPWALTYGNHDTESFTAYNYINLEGLFQSFREDPDCRCSMRTSSRRSTAGITSICALRMQTGA